MIGLNIWRALGDLFTILFTPFNSFKSISDSENWWLSNTTNIILFSIGAALFIYWYGQLIKFSKDGTEDYN